MTAQAKAMIADLAKDLREAVTDIEASIELTQNHYGAYLNILSMAKDGLSKDILVLALIEAGANEQGVRDARKLGG
jgi:hypothetical protein